MCKKAFHEECLGLDSDSLPDPWYCQLCCAESSEGGVPGAATSDDHHVNKPHLAAGEQNDEGRLLGGVPSAPPLAAKHQMKNGIKLQLKQSFERP
jgi:hypothetical protein